MPKINFSKEITQLNGSPIFVQEIKGNQVVLTTERMTLRKACCESLINIQQDEKPTGTEMLERSDLAERIHLSKGEMDLTSKEVTLILSRLEKFSTPWAYAQCYKILEGKDKKK